MSQAPGSAPVGVVVAVDPDRYAQTVDAVRRAGLAVTGEQPLLGSLSGTIAEDLIPLLAAVDGVEAVDRERIVRLPPPGSAAH
ncbi:hypothetical protein ACFV2Z_33360 [Streptomyces sp. NPDC059688]|uniref:Uncharacterized protein n=2 Tax=Streptomyces TaxID=1883 RepID=A0ABY6EM88_9ACTN|nr:MULTISPECIES: hypothetical protein [unclassified Streptomyces]OKJ83244.1 hypothetical protein AMK32_16390 [Streptomyces sp. CB01883]ROP53625.1 hypothetical protein EDD94_3137 [Streptomyces sp. PanSC9]UXY35484.1 hypothetical protein N8I86_12445 [Streptomyces sp. HUAS 14-6]